MGRPSSSEAQLQSITQDATIAPTFHLDEVTKHDGNIPTAFSPHHWRQSVAASSSEPRG